MLKILEEIRECGITMGHMWLKYVYWLGLIGIFTNQPE